MFFRYYAVGLMNGLGKKVKQRKGTVTVVLQVHLLGRPYPLSFYPMPDPWGDDLYYIPSVSFKRSGDYVLSFLLEGADFQHVKPQIYKVHVKANVVYTGPVCALRQLRASGYVQSQQRQISNNRRDFYDLVSTGSVGGEQEAVKKALLLLYAALPLGALSFGPGDWKLKTFE